MNEFFAVNSELSYKHDVLERELQEISVARIQDQEASQKKLEAAEQSKDTL